jgi:hypothetical protein
MARPKKVETIENETISHKMVVVYDTVTKTIILLPESELSPRYKHV